MLLEMDMCLLGRSPESGPAHGREYLIVLLIPGVYVVPHLLTKLSCASEPYC
jgi:hypothetical protein